VSKTLDSPIGFDLDQIAAGKISWTRLTGEA